jgi:hypothetical protein
MAGHEGWRYNVAVRVLVIAAGLALLPVPAAAAPSLGVIAELGPELDTNSTRVTSPQEYVASGLMRMTGSGALRLRTPHHLLVLDAGGGGKVFWRNAARAADELVYHGDLAWGIRAAKSTVWLGSTLYDAYQRESTRDFRSEGLTVQYSIDGPASTHVGLLAAYRGLQYKPDSRYSFHGPGGGVSFDWRLASGRGDAVVDWTLRLQYMAASRFFSGQAIAVPGRCTGLTVLCTEEAARQDLNHQVRAEVQYLGNADASLFYSAEINRSNSYGETYHRHALGLKFTTSLFAGVFLTAKGVLQLSRFRDPYLISEVSNISFASIDDENRSSLVLQLARDVAEHWTINLRYSLFVNESSSQTQASQQDPLAIPIGSFLRQTVFFGVRFEYGRS